MESDNRDSYKHESTDCDDNVTVKIEQSDSQPEFFEGKNVTLSLSPLKYVRNKIILIV